MSFELFKELEASLKKEKRQRRGRRKNEAHLVCSSKCTIHSKATVELITLARNGEASITRKG